MTDKAATLPNFEIFAPGRHTAMTGETLAFADTDVAATAARYDVTIHQAPICVGHPKHDAPAYGWVKGLTVEDGRLVAEPEQIDTAFAELVREGRFKTRSAAFFRPDAPNNPAPGTWYLRHVAFLGAQPPAVKGLKPIAFAEGDDTVVVFGDVSPGRLAWLLRGIGELFRGIRDGVIESDGVEKADKVVPSWRIDQIAEEASRLETEGPHPIFADPAPEEDMTTKPNPGAPSAEELVRREAELNQRAAAFAEREKQARRRDNEAFLDDLVKAGRFVPGMKTTALAFMDQLDADTAVAFAEGDGKTVEKTPLQAFQDLMKAMPKVVEFGEFAPGDDGDKAPVAFAAPAGYAVDPERLQLHEKALAYQAKHPGTEYAAAVKAVGGQ